MKTVHAEKHTKGIPRRDKSIAEAQECERGRDISKERRLYTLALTG